MKPFAVIILAAGQGTRMKSDKAKVLHEILGAPLLCHVIASALPLSPARIVAVVGHQAEEVKKAVAARLPGSGVVYALQEIRLGTGHAVLAAERSLADFSGDVLILAGDAPLLRTETLAGALAGHDESGADLTVLTFKAADPARTRGYGRILRGPSGGLLANVEQRDASPEQLLIDEVNSGIYIADRGLLFRLLKKVGRDNDQKEYYLTDIIALAAAEGRACRADLLADPDEAHGVNTVADLARAEAILSARSGGHARTETGGLAAPAEK